MNKNIQRCGPKLQTKFKISQSEGERERGGRNRKREVVFNAFVSLLNVYKNTMFFSATVEMVKTGTRLSQQIQYTNIG